MMNKILLSLFIVIVVLIGINGYFYFRLNKEPTLPGPPIQNYSTNPTHPTPSLGTITAPTIVEITNSPLSGFTKTQIASLATISAVSTVILDNPVLDEKTKIRLSEILSTASGGFKISQGQFPARILAGWWKNYQENQITVSHAKEPLIQQALTETKIDFSKASRLYMKTKDKLQIVSTLLPLLLQKRLIENYIKSNDLVLAVYVNQKNPNNQADWLVVFQ